MNAQIAYRWMKLLSVVSTIVAVMVAQSGCHNDVAPDMGIPRDALDVKDTAGGLQDAPSRDASDDHFEACTGSESSVSNLPGVSFQFTDDRCSYSRAELAAGIKIHYQLVVAQNLDGIHPGDGACVDPDASGFKITYLIGGGGQGYCLCDVGLCLPHDVVTNPRAATTAEEIFWDGRNWSGPSDTFNPEGPPFPPGTYTLTLRAVGTWDHGAGADGSAGTPFEITATRMIVVTP